MQFLLCARHGSWISAFSLRLKLKGKSALTFAIILSAASVHPEYMMGCKGPGGGKEGAKHWKIFEAFEADAPVLLSDDALSTLGDVG